MPNPRLNFRVPPSVIKLIEETGRKRRISKTAVILRALGIMQAVDGAGLTGRAVVLTKERREDDIPLNSFSPFV